jgi:hypothetical protein
LLRFTLDSFSRKYGNIHDSNMKNVTNGFKFLEELWNNSKNKYPTSPFWHLLIFLPWKLKCLINNFLETPS